MVSVYKPSKQTFIMEDIQEKYNHLLQQNEALRQENEELESLLHAHGIEYKPKHAEEKDAVVSFLVGNIHHLDMGTLLDRLGIAVRTGHHCAQPLMIRLGIQGTVRASFALYNTTEEIDTLVEGIKRVSKMF